MYPHFGGCNADTRNGARGLCMNHYVQARYRVKKGVTTWEEMEENNTCKRKLTQDEKNMNQMHPHRSYRKRGPVVLQEVQTNIAGTTPQIIEPSEDF